jgi:hypothetical protein
MRNPVTLVVIPVLIAVLSGCAQNSGVSTSSPSPSPSPLPSPSPSPTYEAVAPPESLGFADGTLLSDDVEVSIWPHLVDEPGWKRSAGFEEGDLAFANAATGCRVNINLREVSGKADDGSHDKSGSRAIIRTTYNITQPFQTFTEKVARDGGGTVSFLSAQLEGKGKDNKGATGFAIARHFGAANRDVIIDVLCDGKGAKKVYTAEVKPRLVVQLARIVQP